MSSAPKQGNPPGSDGGLLADRYRLLEPVGKGGSATVYRAWDPYESRFVAVKVLSRHVSGSAATRSRLLNEAELLASLEHPNVVTLFDSGIDGERVYLVMELLRDGSVMDRVAGHGPLPPRMAVQVVTSVLSALQAAHDRGVVHRDVKPHNILLDSNGVPKVTDFGIARWDDQRLTRTGAVLGTLAYMPPEQKHGRRRVDVRCDLYATGATLHVLLTGREPHDLYAAGLDEDIGRELFAGVPPALVNVMLQATAFRPEDRFASAMAMSAALAGAVGDLPPDPVGTPLVSPDLARRRERSSSGPTLLGVTDGGDGGPVARLSSLPPLSGPTKVRPVWPWVLALGAMLVVGLVAYGRWVGPLPMQPEWLAPASIDIAVVAPAEGVVPAVVDTTPAPVRRPRPAPVAVAEDVAVAEEVAPELDADAGAVTPHVREVGGWRVQWLPTGKNKGDVTAILWAVQTVQTQVNSVRPSLILRCNARRPFVILRTGVQGESTHAHVTVTDGRGSDVVRASVDPRLAGELLFPSAFEWMDRLLSTDPVEVHYTIEADTAADVTFRPGSPEDVAVVREALRGCL